MRLGQSLYNSIFPPTFALSPREQALLGKMYPAIDWSRVEFHGQLPWFMRYSFAIGVALPDAYNRYLVRVHLRDIGRLSPLERCSILVHEAFHVQQYHDLDSLEQRGWSWGYNRRFMRYYLGWYYQTLWEALWQQRLPWRKAKRHAYRQHPMERTAYWQEGLFCKYCKLYQERSIEELFELVPHLVCTHSRVPQAPAWPFHGAAAFLGILMMLSKPFLDVLLYPFALALGGRSLKSRSPNA